VKCWGNLQRTGDENEGEREREDIRRRTTKRETIGYK
jgi:hypothetical protein